MVKKIIAGAFIFFVISTSGNIVCYANNTIDNSQYEIEVAETNKHFFEVLEPKKNIVSTDKSILLSFRASEGTNVRIEVYNSVNTDNKKEDYVMYYEPIEITVGALQKGWASIDLKPGLNKIIFTAKYKDESEDSIERTINVMDVQEVKQILQDVVNKSTLGIGKR